MWMKQGGYSWDGYDRNRVGAAVRTPISRAKRGPFATLYPDQLLVPVLRALHERTGINPAAVQDIVVGNVLQPGAGATVARMAALAAGYPVETAVAAVNRQCSSGLQACAQIAAAIHAGWIDVGVGAGVESMTKGYGAGAMSETSDEILDIPQAADCLLPMGTTSENVAKEFRVARSDQDELAVKSHAKAAHARANGWFKQEIVPVPVTVEDKDGTEKRFVVAEDDGIRPGTSMASLAKLKPAFAEDGTTTAGNASQVSDGAAAVLLMRRSKAKQLGLKPLATFVTAAVVGVPPRVMGIGPAFAIPMACKQAGIRVQDLDVVELNEAFASQAVYCMRQLGLGEEKVNPCGGAIALGHPLGCTGARQIATLLPQLHRTKQRWGCVSMCIGTGMGMAAIIRRED